MAASSFIIFTLCMCVISVSCASPWHVDPVSIKSVESTEFNFTFAHEDSYLEIQPSWKLKSENEFSFNFRTHQVNSLLAYVGIQDFPGYSLTVLLENGKIKVINEVHDNMHSMVIGKGLNKDHWHTLHVVLSPKIGNITATLGENSINSMPLQSPDKQYGENIENFFIYFGGVASENLASKYPSNFIGCMGKIQVSQQSSSLQFSKSTSLSNLYDGCYDRCRGQTFCMNDAPCINHYSHYTCDCFGTGYEKRYCNDDDLTTVTLYGNEYLTYRIFDWKDRAHSELNRISLYFRTFYDNSVLLYGHGALPVKNYLSAILKNGKVVVTVNFGDGEKSVEVGRYLNNGIWRNLTIHHRRRVVEVVVDSRDDWNGTMNWPEGSRHHLHFNPEIIIGGSLNQDQSLPGLETNLNFVGSLHSVYYNDQNILRKMADGSNSIHHHGQFPVKYGYHEIVNIPLTFSFPSSAINVPYSEKPLSFTFEFKTMKADGILVSSSTPEDSTDHWEISLAGGYFNFELRHSSSKNVGSVKGKKKLNDDTWHAIDFSFYDGELSVVVDFKDEITKAFEEKNLKQQNHITLGGSMIHPSKGFVGCMRKIVIADNLLDARELTSKYTNGVSIDNCELVDPCKKENVCEHGGKCSVLNNEIVCDCTGTGYVGKTCHFSIYNRTCEELYISGFRKSGIYKIDIDRNGPFPPSLVHCDMNGMDEETGESAIITTIENNVPREWEIWNGPNKNGISFNVSYRDMTVKMLNEFIKSSKRCYQSIEYHCLKAPLFLGSYTWFKSPVSKEIVSSVGSSIPGHCSCSDSGSCLKSTNSSKYLCNCDANSAKHDVDEGVNYVDDTLGITEMFFVPPSELSSDSRSSITLGALQCLNADTQKHIITFKTKESYIKVPDWQSGELSFSFKTTVSDALLFYQSAQHSSVGYLQISLVEGNSVVFDFVINGQPRNVTLRLPNNINDINWHQVLVDYAEHHIRMSVDHVSRFIDLQGNENFGPFEGAVFIGGMPKHHFQKHKEIFFDVPHSFQGCFRGLVMNGNAVNLENFIPNDSKNVEKGCTESCNPNPCKNEAPCKELWSDYECKCVDKILHTGKDCELESQSSSEEYTFRTLKSTISSNYQSKLTDTLLTSDIAITFRTYEKKALLLFANNHQDNFILLHFDEGNTVYFTFNHQRSVVRLENKIKGTFHGQKIKVLIKREQDKTTLIVNDNPVSIDKPVSLLRKFIPKDVFTEGEKYALVKITRMSFEFPPYNQYMIGGINADSGAKSELPGFIGCLQNFLVNNAVHRSFKNITEEELNSANVEKGCNLLCNNMPCKNKGLCIEDVAQKSTSCLCSDTSYDGQFCERDVGGSFEGKNIIVFSIDESTKLPETLEVELAFSTDMKPAKDTLLLYLQNEEQMPFFLFLTVKGHLAVSEMFSSQKIVTTRAVNRYNDGHRHWVTYKYEGKKIKSFKVDGEEFASGGNQFTRSLNSSKVSVEAQSAIIIGGVQEDVSLPYENYEGCISNIMIKIDSKVVKPLHVVYGYEEDKKQRKSIEVNEQRCEMFGPIMIVSSEKVFNTIPAELTGPKWTPEPPNIQPYALASKKPVVLAAKMPIATIVLAVLLLLVVIAVIIYMYRLNRREKKRQFEDDTTFFSNRSPVKKSPPGQDEPDDFDFPAKDIPPQHEMSPLKPSSSQELEWDPGAENDNLIYPSLLDMNPEAIEERAGGYDPYSVPPESQSKHLPSAGEAPNKRYSTGSLPRPSSMHVPLGTISEVIEKYPGSQPRNSIDYTDAVDGKPIPIVADSSENITDVEPTTQSYSPALPPKKRRPPPLPPKKGKPKLL